VGKVNLCHWCRRACGPCPSWGQNGMRQAWAADMYATGCASRLLGAHRPERPPPRLPRCPQAVLLWAPCQIILVFYFLFIFGVFDGGQAWLGGEAHG